MGCAEVNDQGASFWELVMTQVVVWDAVVHDVIIICHLDLDTQWT